MQNSPRLQRVPTLQRITEIGATTDKAVSALSVTVGATADCVLSRGAAGDMTFGDTLTYNDRKLQDVRVNKLYRAEIVTDFTSPTEIQWTGAAIAAGTSPVGGWSINHPGTRIIRTLAGAGTGYYYYASANSGVQNPGRKVTFVFQVTDSHIVAYYGIMYQAPTAAPVTGSWVEIATTTRVCTGKTDNGTGSSNATGTTYTMSEDVWYRCEVEISTDGNTAYFRVYTCSDQALVWSESLTNYGIGKTTNDGIISAWSSDASGPYDLLLIDYACAECTIDQIR